MNTTTRNLLDLTAEELMSREVVVIQQEMSLRAAAHRLIQEGISGAPVIDAHGRCVGVISRADLVRFFDQGDLLVEVEADTSEYVAEWGVVELGKLPTDDVLHHMTTTVVTASPHTRIGELARIMQREHIHRVLIADADSRVIGIVASMDILGALAAADAEIHS